MKAAPSRPLLAVIALVAALLTCLGAAHVGLGGAIGLPLPWQFHDHRWWPVDYRVVVGDGVFWFVSYYGLLRGLVLMWTSPHRLPFSRRRAYGEDPTAWPVRHLRTFVLVGVFHFATCVYLGVLGESVFMRIYPTLADRLVQIVTFPAFTVAELLWPEGVGTPLFYGLVIANSSVWAAAAVGIHAFLLSRRRHSPREVGPTDPVAGSREG